MKYENASDVLPAALLKEIQRYAAGKLLYIPMGEDKKAWGESSGYREQLYKRNRMIRNKYAHGMTVSELADEYYLSLDSIKKIIYSKKHDRQLTYAPTLESAVRYTGAGLLEEWVQCYSLLTQKAAIEQDDNTSEPLYFGVVKFPVRLIQYDGMVPQQEQEEPAGDEGHFLPPLLIEYTSGKFYSRDQDQLLANLKQRKVNAYPSIIVLPSNTDYKRFMQLYGTVLFFVE